jgi:hypothetical protein
MEEIWKPVLGYEQYYAVSNIGRIKSLARKLGIGVNKQHMVDNIRKTNIMNGYEGFSINIPKHKPNTMGVARAMLEAFNPVPNMENLEVNHKNGNNTHLNKDFDKGEVKWNEIPKLSQKRWLLTARRLQEKQREERYLLWMTVYERLCEIEDYISGNQWCESDWKEWVNELKSHFCKDEEGKE